MTPDEPPPIEPSPGVPAASRPKSATTAPAPPADELTRLLGTHGQREIVNVDVARAQFVVFTVGGEGFALPGPQVAEILPLLPVFPVPGAPAAVAGVIDVRGRICSVLNATDLLGCPGGRDGAILLGRAAGMESGLAVTRVDDVLEVPEAAVLAPPDNLPERLRGLVTGVFPVRGRQVLALDLDPLFTAWRDGRLG